MWTNIYDSLMAAEHFKARDIGLRTQKKLLSRMSNKTTLKIFIDDRSAAVLDNTYKLFKQYAGSKKDAEKLIKCIIKIIVKIGILYRNGEFNKEEMEMATKLRTNFHKVVMTIVSFHELDYSYEYPYLLLLLNNLHDNLRFLIQNHLTPKSVNRLDHVFQYTIKREFCDAVFAKNSPFQDLMGKIVGDLTYILENEK